MSPFLLTRTLPEDATDAALRADVLRPPLVTIPLLGATGLSSQNSHSLMSTEARHS